MNNLANTTVLRFGESIDFKYIWWEQKKGYII